MTAVKSIQIIVVTEYTTQVKYVKYCYTQSETGQIHITAWHHMIHDYHKPV